MNCFCDRSAFGGAMNDPQSLVLSAESEEELEAWLRALLTNGALLLTPVLNGWLQKTVAPSETHLPKSSWQPRYLCLLQDRLQEFGSETDIFPKSELPLPRTAFWGPVDPQFGPQNMLSVGVNGDANSATFYLAASNPEQCAEWITTLQGLLGEARHTFPKFKDSVIEGYLFRSSNSKRTWHKRYFVLRPSGKLSYYHRKTDSKPASTLVVHGSGVVEHLIGEDANGRDNAFRVAESGDAGSPQLALLAASGRERNRWIQAITNVVAPTVVPKSRYSMFEGYLAQRDGTGVLQQYFAVLNSKRLVLFSSWSDETPARVLEATEFSTVADADKDGLAFAIDGQVFEAQSKRAKITLMFFLHALSEGRTKQMFEMLHDYEAPLEALLCDRTGIAIFRHYAVSVAKTSPELLKALDTVQEHVLEQNPWSLEPMPTYPQAVYAHYDNFLESGVYHAARKQLFSVTQKQLRDALTMTAERARSSVAEARSFFRLNASGSTTPDLSREWDSPLQAPPRALSPSFLEVGRSVGLLCVL